MSVGEAFGTAGKVGSRAFRPKSVPAGQRIRQPTHKKKYKAKPKVGKGEYVKAPLMRDKLTQPRWMANAALNNPGNVLAAGGIGTGGGIILGNQKKKIEKADRDRSKNAAAGGLIGGGAGHFARVGADYGSKATAERQFKPLTTKGNYGPYTEGPHKPTLNKYKRTVKGDVRTKAKMFDENFPKGIPSHNARKVGVMLNKKPAVAGAVLGAAAIGAGVGATRKVKKNMSTSAFGIDHGVVSKLDYGEGKKPSGGRKVLASAPYTSVVHPFVAGKKGKKARSAGNQIGMGAAGGLGGSLAGQAVGAIASRGNRGATMGAGIVGGAGGGIYGSQRGLARNTRKGYLKKES